ncbi:MAG TPA: hypothetical protein VFN09_10200 [Rhodanobacteraceae bacterium]|nr:hypothetical protein [Rhodanobacteraceae bacterium]
MRSTHILSLRRHLLLFWLGAGAAVSLWLPLRVDDPRYGWSLAWWLLGAPLLMALLAWGPRGRAQQRLRIPARCASIRATPIIPHAAPRSLSVIPRAA